MPKYQRKRNSVTAICLSESSGYVSLVTSSFRRSTVANVCVVVESQQVQPDDGSWPRLHSITPVFRCIFDLPFATTWLSSLTHLIRPSTRRRALVIDALLIIGRTNAISGRLSHHRLHQSICPSTIFLMERIFLMQRDVTKLLEMTKISF